jgi:hypothetical protein
MHGVVAYAVYVALGEEQVWPHVCQLALGHHHHHYTLG